MDLNVRPLSRADLDWADLVFASAMLVQKESFERLIRRVNAAGKPMVAGGPFPARCREAIEGVAYLVLNEVGVTLPPLIEDFEEDRAKGVYASEERPDLSLTPRPRYDLIDLRPYSSMMLQYSRGCPNDCEFCDIIELYGRKPRVKSPERFVGEIEALCRIGLAGDEGLLALMAGAGFAMAFIGIEVAAGFIIGFDADPEDVAERKIAFIQESGVATAMVGLLTALPQTAQYRRLLAEGRILGESSGDNTHELRLNFVPKMEAARLLDAYVEVLSGIYSPRLYFQRCGVLLSRLPRRSAAGAAATAGRSRLENARALVSPFVRQALSPYGGLYRRFHVATLLRRPWAFPKAIEQSILVCSLIAITRKKVVEPWARTKALERDMALAIGRLESLMEEGVPADLEGALAKTAMLRSGLSSVAALAVEDPVPALAEPLVRTCSALDSTVFAIGSEMRASVGPAG